MAIVNCITSSNLIHNSFGGRILYEVIRKIVFRKSMHVTKWKPTFNGFQVELILWQLYSLFWPHPYIFGPLHNFVWTRWVVKTHEIAPKLFFQLTYRYIWNIYHYISPSYHNKEYCIIKHLKVLSSLFHCFKIHSCLSYCLNSYQV